jgi:hypothetical protein
LCAEEGLQRVIAPELPVQSYLLGSLQWSLDGETIYAAVVTATDDDHVAQYSIGEIPLTGDPPRLVPIARLLESESDLSWSDLPLLGISLSPDGSTIATALAEDDPDIAPDDRALYLVDMRDPDRRVTKIELPFLHPKAAADAEN